MHIQVQLQFEFQEVRRFVLPLLGLGIGEAYLDLGERLVAVVFVLAVAVVVVVPPFAVVASSLDVVSFAVAASSVAVGLQLAVLLVLVDVTFQLVVAVLEEGVHPAHVFLDTLAVELEEAFDVGPEEDLVDDLVEAFVAFEDDLGVVFAAFEAVLEELLAVLGVACVAFGVGLEEAFVAFGADLVVAFVASVVVPVEAFVAL